MIKGSKSYRKRDDESCKGEITMPTETRRLLLFGLAGLLALALLVAVIWGAVELSNTRKAQEASQIVAEALVWCEGEEPSEPSKATLAVQEARKANQAAWDEYRVRYSRGRQVSPILAFPDVSGMIYDACRQATKAKSLLGDERESRILAYNEANSAIYRIKTSIASPEEVFEDARQALDSVNVAEDELQEARWQTRHASGNVLDLPGAWDSIDDAQRHLEAAFTFLTTGQWDKASNEAWYAKSLAEEAYSLASTPTPTPRPEPTRTPRPVVIPEELSYPTATPGAQDEFFFPTATPGSFGDFAPTQATPGSQGGW